MRVVITGRPNHPHAQEGQTLDLPEAEAVDMLQRGTAVRAVDEPPEELPGEPIPEPAPEPELADAEPESEPESAAASPKPKRAPKKK